MEWHSTLKKNKLGIMQPYFFPYLGYWQLINSVDEFVIYDNIQYTKKGWINRNRYLCEGKVKYMTVPLVKASDYLNIDERMISPVFERNKLIKKLEEAYKRAPFFDTCMGIIIKIINNESNCLFNYIYNSIMQMLEFLEISTNVVISSQIPIDHTLRADDKVLAICKHLECANYINAIGGIGLYSKKQFEDQDIQLNFLKTDSISYDQCCSLFQSNLSIIDVLMYCGKLRVREMLSNYELL